MDYYAEADSQAAAAAGVSNCSGGGHPFCVSPPFDALDFAVNLVCPPRRLLLTRIVASPSALSATANLLGADVWGGGSSGVSGFSCLAVNPDSIPGHRTTICRQNGVLTIQLLSVPSIPKKHFPGLQSLS